MTLSDFFGLLKTAPAIMVRAGGEAVLRTPGHALLHRRVQAIRHGRSDGDLSGKRKSHTLLSGVIAFRKVGTKK